MANFFALVQSKTNFKSGGQECPPHTSRINFYSVGLVIAPCDADDTKAAYFANTPVG